MNNKDNDQTAWVCRLVYAFVVPMQQTQVFLLRGPNENDFLIFQYEGLDRDY